MKEAASTPRSSLPSSAAVRSARFAHPGDEVAPNRCTVIRYSLGSLVVSPWSHQRKRRRSRCSSLTWTWWNIPSISQANATGSCLKRHSTPISEFVRSGPCRRWRLREWPWNSAEQSKTTRSFSGFLGWYTPWWGMYHALSYCFGAFSAWPFFSIFSMKVT